METSHNSPGAYARMVQRLLKTPHSLISYDELIEAIYPCANDQPEDAKRAIRVMIHQARRSGWRIDNHNRRGYILI